MDRNLGRVRPTCVCSGTTTLSLKPIKFPMVPRSNFPPAGVTSIRLGIWFSCKKISGGKASSKVLALY